MDARARELAESVRALVACAREKWRGSLRIDGLAGELERCLAGYLVCSQVATRNPRSCANLSRS